MEDRVLILAPRGRDAEVIEGVLRAQGIVCHGCRDFAELLQEISREAAAVIVTEEALAGDSMQALGDYLGAQPAWSDFPFVVLATRQTGRRSQSALHSLQELGNIVLLERPVNPETLASAARSALRARLRQYATRRHLAALEESRATVERLNTELENRIGERTADLSQANNRLMREIAERERAQASVVQGQKMEAIGRLTGGMAHDFNNLLHVVNINLQMIARTAKDPASADHARRAREAVTRGSRLTAQLLSFARAQSLVPKLQDVNQLLTNLSELIGVSVGSRIEVVLDLWPGRVSAVLDSAQLEMAVLNMAVNSRDAMAGGGRLVIRTEVRNQPDGQREAILSVRDTGSGIPPALLEKVFDPFFTTKPVGEGTGLGLSQVYGFAQQSGGRAELKSAVGQGTTVELRFPLAEGADFAGDGNGGKPAGMPEGRPGMEILVVEDDAGVRQTMVECLRMLRYTVHEATDGLAGLRALEKCRPTLLLADYLMPGMNGAELIAAARVLHPDLPILLATGYADMAQVQQVLGRQAVLRKPFDVETLATTVAAAIQRSEPAEPDVPPLAVNDLLRMEKRAG
ncbi:response regulator [Xylophilus rhododendri]|uniref:histidine kinase n=1 Tax=Xylophilus rhododendri TaxID=2697032 RepID=A0A857J8K7_9BURK|nr:ATP-binding protein [Xylophilus rhododendri]QHJ00381.1 response regulator [Xylophilus rhododendri]